MSVTKAPSILFISFSSLSEYSDENMMDPYNIAICFGPTLVPVPEDKDQVRSSLVYNTCLKISSFLSLLIPGAVPKPRK